MLDPRFVATEPDLVREHLRLRRADADTLALVDRIVALQAERAAAVTELDGLRARRNAESAEIGRLMGSVGKLRKADQLDEAAAVEASVEQKKAEVQAINAASAGLEARVGALEAELRDKALRLPNLLDPSVPEGASEHDNVVVDTFGTPGAYAFEPQSHVEIGEKLGILDLERGAKLSGARFWVLTGLGARLERALLNFFLDLQTGEHGYTEVMVPYIVAARVAEGTGQLPKFAGDMFKIAGEVNGSEAYLVPTAELPVTNLHREEILEEDELPKRYACFSPCFRSEAGSAGRDVRGLIRVHQFHKVEIVWVCRPEDSAAAHEQLTRHAEEGLRRLGLPYRKVLLCSGDISFGATRCYDLEVWLPSQKAYREVSSCSSFGDFQARRMDLRYRPKDATGKKGKTAFCHTLNGSGLPLGRVLVAILENGQQADGSVVIPEALRPYLGGVDVIRPA